jgi:hypothetical protein
VVGKNLFIEIVRVVCSHDEQSWLTEVIDEVRVGMISAREVSLVAPDLRRCFQVLAVEHHLNIMNLCRERLRQGQGCIQYCRISSGSRR